MAWSIDTGSAARRASIIAASFVFAALLGLGSFADSASAQRRDDDRRSDGRGNDGRGNDGRGNRGRGHDKHPNWSGGYYRAPPVIHRTPYPHRYNPGPQYAPPRFRPPPVIYGPGLNFNFQVR